MWERMKLLGHFPIPPFPHSHILYSAFPHSRIPTFPHSHIPALHGLLSCEAADASVPFSSARSPTRAR